MCGKKYTGRLSDKYLHHHHHHHRHNPPNLVTISWANLAIILIILIIISSEIVASAPVEIVEAINSTRKSNETVLRSNTAPIDGINDLFLAEFPRHFEHFEQSRAANSTERQNSIKRLIIVSDRARLRATIHDWIRQRLREIATADKVRRCAAKAICQTAKYVRRLLGSRSSSIASHFRCGDDRSSVDRIDFGGTLGEYDCDQVWRESFENSVGAHFCRRQFPCDNPLVDVNFVSLQRIRTRSTLDDTSQRKGFDNISHIDEKTQVDEKTANKEARSEAELPRDDVDEEERNWSVHETWPWIIAQMEMIAFHRSKIGNRNFSENCRVRSIGRISSRISKSPLFGNACGHNRHPHPHHHHHHHYDLVQNSNCTMNISILTPNVARRHPSTPTTLTSTIVTSLGINKFAEAWHRAANAEIEPQLDDELDYRYPCDLTFEGDLVRAHVRHVLRRVERLEQNQRSQTSIANN